jgi:glyoxylase I family protein
MFKRIDHVELVPSNYERSITFYTDILGFKIKERHTITMPPLREIIYITLGDTMMELLDVEAPTPTLGEPWQVSFNAIALEVDSMEETVAFLKCKGVEIAWGPTDIGGSIRAEIRDPDGMTIELREWL